MSARTWDIFCSVVDNFGDVGVCWRLARQLSSELEQNVRLFVDDLTVLHAMCGAVDPQRESQRLENVEVVHWRPDFPDAVPADIVVEGFGARVPDVYLKAMAARAPHSVWILLEYLSAEDWVEGCHGLPSPHPDLPLTKYFFFPGFTAATGGLIVEWGLADARDAFQRSATAKAEFLASLGLRTRIKDALNVSFFAYKNAALPALVEAWITGQEHTLCVVPAGKVLTQLEGIIGRPLQPGASVELGSLCIAPIPFLELDAYDRLLWACDVNFVRGEDSFVRAQLAGQPMVWQAYPQREVAHLRKVAAFLDHYMDGNASALLAHRALTEAWNTESVDATQRWKEFLAHRAAAAAHARTWADKLTAFPGLAQKLAAFAEDRLK